MGVIKHVITGICKNVHTHTHMHARMHTLHTEAMIYLNNILVYTNQTNKQRSTISINSSILES